MSAFSRDGPNRFWHSPEMLSSSTSRVETDMSPVTCLWCIPSDGDSNTSEETMEVLRISLQKTSGHSVITLTQYSTQCDCSTLNNHGKKGRNETAPSHEFPCLQRACMTSGPSACQKTPFMAALLAAFRCSYTA